MKTGILHTVSGKGRIGKEKVRRRKAQVLHGTPISVGRGRMFQGPNAVKAVHKNVYEMRKRRGVEKETFRSSDFLGERPPHFTRLKKCKRKDNH